MDILKEIDKDIRAFADPGSPVVVEPSSAVWEKDGKECSIKFTAAGPNSFPDVNILKKRMSYRSFLASEWMADLHSLGEFILKTHQRSYEYLETSARIEDDEPPQADGQPATDAILIRSTKDLPFLSTRVVLVRGEAGSGKTITLREVTIRQARAYKEGRADSLFFFIDAQGRALSRLEDAMAKDLQDLRSKFSYSAIGPLTRHNLIIPIIDGFDELLGSGGYDEAFSSLAAFLATLDGQGSVVASARSAFFDYRNFYENAKRFSGEGSLNYIVEAINILPWNQEQIREYFHGIGEKYPAGANEMMLALEGIQTSMNSVNRELLSKPFYASRVAQLLAEKQELKTDEDLLDQLVEAFIEREHAKLLNKEGKPMLSQKGHRAFLTGLAEEMWWQENKRLDVGTVQAVAELVTEDFGLPPTAAHAIVERVSSYAFLTSERSGKRFLRFEHEVFYGYFLAHKLRDMIERQPADLRRFLARSVADATIVDQAVKLIGNDVERCTRAVEAVSSVLRPYLSEVLARENAGLMIAALMRSAGSLRAAVTIRNTIFRQVSFGTVELIRPRFEECDLEDVDFGNVHFTSPVFVNTSLRNIAVNPGRTLFTNTDSSVLDQIFGLVVLGDTPRLPTGHLFAPEDIAMVMASMGVKVAQPLGGKRLYSQTVQKRIELLGRFIRKMERRFYVTEEDAKSFPFARDREWGMVWDLMQDHGLLERLILPKSGPRQPLIRLSVPPDVLRKGEATNDPTVPAKVAGFWKSLLTST